MPPVTFDAILFDLDGTLADSAADIGRALRYAFDDLGVPLRCTVDSLVDGSPLEELFAVAVPDATPAQFERFVARYRAHYLAAGHADTRLYPGVVDTLESLRLLRPRPRLAVATSKRSEAARHLCVATGIAHYFDAIEGSGGTAVRPKPAPDLLLAVTRALGVEASRTLMVGDTARDVRAGKAAGMRTAAVLYGMASREALAEERPDHLFEDIEDVLLLLGER